MKVIRLETLLTDETGDTGETSETSENFLLWLNKQVQRFFRWLVVLFEDETPDAKVEPATLLSEITQARHDVHWAQNYFNNVNDKNLLDYAIYQMLAAESKYSYFLKLKRSEEEQPSDFMSK